MYNARIIDNKPVCGHCGSSNLSGLRDYSYVEMNENTYTMFQFQCYTCREYGRYLANVMLDETKRYEITGKIKSTTVE